MRISTPFICLGVQLLFSSLVYAKTVCVRVPNASATFQASGSSVTLSQYTPLSWTGKSESQSFEVSDMEGRNFWIRKSDISFSHSCLAVGAEHSQLMTGPGAKFKKAGKAQRGDVFLSLGAEDGWIHVQNQKGKKSWINLDHIWRPENKVRMSFERER
jgi:hypothetical protein